MNPFRRKLDSNPKRERQSTRSFGIPGIFTLRQKVAPEVELKPDPNNHTLQVAAGDKRPEFELNQTKGASGNVVISAETAGAQSMEARAKSSPAKSQPAKPPTAADAFTVTPDSSKSSAFELKADKNPTVTLVAPASGRAELRTDSHDEAEKAKARLAQSELETRPSAPKTPEEMERYVAAQQASVNAALRAIEEPQHAQPQRHTSGGVQSYSRAAAQPQPISGDSANRESKGQIQVRMDAQSQPAPQTPAVAESQSSVASQSSARNPLTGSSRSSSEAAANVNGEKSTGVAATSRPARIRGDAKPVISIRGVKKIYQMGDIEVQALRGVDLDIYQGEIMAIMGPSGSGKSTLMNILGCLDVPTEGVYLLDGVDVRELNDNQLADIRNRKIGFVFQSFNLLSRTTALANVELPLLYLGVRGRERRNRAVESLSLVGLGERLDHRPNELSGGQQQRVAIARALINRPAMILADEPTGNLDSKTRIEIMKLFQRLNRDQGITVIFVTHDPDTAAYCERVVMVRDGTVARDQRHNITAGIYAEEDSNSPAGPELEQIVAQALGFENGQNGVAGADANEVRASVVATTEQPVVVPPPSQKFELPLL